MILRACKKLSGSFMQEKFHDVYPNKCSLFVASLKKVKLIGLCEVSVMLSEMCSTLQVIST